MTSGLVRERCSSSSTGPGRRLLAEVDAPAAFVKFYEDLFGFLGISLSRGLKTFSKTWLVLHSFIATAAKCQFYSDRAALALEQVNDFDSDRSSQ